MAKWDTIFRQVALRANQLQADTTADLASNYEEPLIGQAEMTDRAIEFPELAIDDAILNAADRLVRVFAFDPYSPYRTPFLDTGTNLTNGAVINDNIQNMVGVIGDVRDSITSTKLVAKEYSEVVGVSNLATLKQEPHWYYTDNIRIWHTRTIVKCDAVIWDKDEQLTLMQQTAGGERGDCPFPEDLHEALVSGALSYVFRGDFNSDQVKTWRAYFEQTLQGMNPLVQERKLAE